MNFDPLVIDDLARAATGARLTDEAARRLLALREALAGPALLFQCPAPGRFLVGDPDAPAVLDCSILAAAGAQLALANPGRADLVRVADFAAPGVEYPANSVRAGIKRFADFLELNGQRALASEVRRVTVGEKFISAPGRRRFNLITD
ncbi:MAG: hypothetical protein HXX19_10655 [Rhodoferax sp.]|nr:hypothetical protein [Rhodoferax sp.]